MPRILQNIYLKISPVAQLHIAVTIVIIVTQEHRSATVMCATIILKYGLNNMQQAINDSINALYWIIRERH